MIQEKTKMQKRIDSIDFKQIIDRIDSLQSKGKLVLEVQVGDWFYLSDGVQIKLENFNNGYIKVAIKAADDIHILRHDLYEMLKKKRSIANE